MALQGLGQNTKDLTLLAAVAGSLSTATRYHTGVEERPAAVLWTDADRQWQPLVKRLQEQLLQLVVLGDYDAAQRIGPAVWLKCIVARTIDIGLGPDVVPIVYLPGVSRQALRAAAECPVLLQPLVELQYRGVVWTQRNGKDWTLEAFLVSDDGLGLQMARDDATRNSLHSALPVLLETPVAQLEDKQLEAEDFDKLMVGDHPRDLLEWMNDPKSMRAGWGEGKWHAFRSRCRKDYFFDPDEEGNIGAAQLLGLRKEKMWQQLWERFAEAPTLYRSIPELLARAKPSELLFNPECWPDENDRAEAELRVELSNLATADSSTARRCVSDLEVAHGERRKWVWARMDRSPLAMALEHLSTLAKKTLKPLSGSSLDEVVANYIGGGYEADLALLRSLAVVKANQDRAAVHTAARALYLPWLRAGAELFQKLVSKTPLNGAGQQPAIEASEGECLLFVDGLRFDLGQELRALCEERGFRVTAGQRWAGTPTVTATAKPAVSPVSGELHGDIIMPAHFAPSLKSNGQDLSAPRFRGLLEAAGYQVLAIGETGDVNGKGWSECGSIDRRGHDLELELASQVADELDRIIERIEELLEAGWRAVHVVTDHGWLLVPGGLPKTELPGYLVNSRWARCAAIKGQSKVSVPKVGWFWNASAEAAIAPDVTAFVAGLAYAHGGLSIQECLVPTLLIQSAKAGEPEAGRIKSVEWQRLRCRVTLASPMAGVMVDIRTKANVAGTSVASAPRTTDANGEVALIVPDDELAGSAAVVVLLDPLGNVLRKQATTIGES